jgi:hypothetical protein
VAAFGRHQWRRPSRRGWWQSGLVAGLLAPSRIQCFKIRWNLLTFGGFGLVYTEFADKFRFGLVRILGVCRIFEHCSHLKEAT